MKAEPGRRIIVIGSPGAGKSTVSTHLAKIYGLPIFHLDRLYWLPGWKHVSDQEFDSKLNKIITLEDWIIDGNYQRTLEMRYHVADTVIYLDFNRYLCLFRSMKRTIFHKRHRTDITEGCVERLNMEFLKWIWNYDKRNRPDTLKLIQRNDGKEIFHFRNPRELKKFFQELENLYPENKTHN